MSEHALKQYLAFGLDSEVFDISGESIEPPPPGCSLTASHNEGLGCQRERVVVLLDVDSVSADEEMALRRTPESEAA